MMSKRKSKDRFQGKPLLAEVAFFSGDDEVGKARVFDLSVHSNQKKFVDSVIWGLGQGHEMEILRKEPFGRVAMAQNTTDGYVGRNTGLGGKALTKGARS